MQLYFCITRCGLSWYLTVTSGDVAVAAGFLFDSEDVTDVAADELSQFLFLSFFWSSCWWCSTINLSGRYCDVFTDAVLLSQSLLQYSLLSHTVISLWCSLGGQCLVQSLVSQSLGSLWWVSVWCSIWWVSLWCSLWWVSLWCSLWWVSLCAVFGESVFGAVFGESVFGGLSLMQYSLFLTDFTIYWSPCLIFWLPFATFEQLFLPL